MRKSLTRQKPIKNVRSPKTSFKFQKLERERLVLGPLPTDSGREIHILVWISYEEPLQTSCLGKKGLMIFHVSSPKFLLVISLVFPLNFLGETW